MTPLPVLFAVLLFDTADFMPRWHCGNWTALHGFTHIIADTAIAGAYVFIALAIAVFWWLKRDELAFPGLFGLFAIFILGCGRPIWSTPSFSTSRSIDSRRC